MLAAVSAGKYDVIIARTGVLITTVKSGRVRGLLTGAVELARNAQGTARS
jgi:hypothetical protein